MITIRKLMTLPPSTRHRKMILLLETLEREGILSADPTYITALIKAIAEDSDLEEWVREIVRQRQSLLDLRAINGIRHALLQYTGAFPAEWDLLPRKGEVLMESSSELPIILYLEDIRSPYNIGSFFRIAAAYGVSELLLSPGCASPEHKRACRTAMGSVGVIPWRICPVEEAPGPLVALETGGVSITEFVFPPRGTLLLGSEELGLSPKTLTLADGDGGRVSIPTQSAKATLNVSVAAGIGVEAWRNTLAKQ